MSKKISDSVLTVSNEEFTLNSMDITGIKKKARMRKQAFKRFRTSFLNNFDGLVKAYGLDDIRDLHMMLDDAASKNKYLRKEVKNAIRNEARLKELSDYNALEIDCANDFQLVERAISLIPNINNDC